MAQAPIWMISGITSSHNIDIVLKEINIEGLGPYAFGICSNYLLELHHFYQYVVQNNQ